MPNYYWRTKEDGVLHGRFEGGYDKKAVSEQIKKVAEREGWGPGEVVEAEKTLPVDPKISGNPQKEVHAGK
jgi:hypothetical protein